MKNEENQGERASGSMYEVPRMCMVYGWLCVVVYTCKKTILLLLKTQCVVKDWLQQLVFAHASCHTVINHHVVAVLLAV